MLDEAAVEAARREAARTGRSLSAVVREAMAEWLAARAPDTAWMGSLRPDEDSDHDWESIRRSIATGMGGRTRR